VLARLSWGASQLNYPICVNTVLKGNPLDTGFLEEVAQRGWVENAPKGDQGGNDRARLGRCGSRYSRKLHQTPQLSMSHPRLYSDVEALMSLTSPPKRAVRPRASAIALYGFANTPGSGFGSTLLIKNTIHYRHGQWGKQYDEVSLNYRELDNLITAVEDAQRGGGVV
jgi:hypothetical protein